MALATFRKSRGGATADYYAAEAAGLRWITVPCGPPTPAIKSVEADALVLERIGDRAPSTEAAEAFGVALATMHGAQADAFGSAPIGAPQHGWIADLPMPFGSFRSFGPMYSELRVRPFLRRCAATNLFEPSEVSHFVRLCDALEAESPQLVGPAEGPARLHGDLWSGNLLWSSDRAGKAAVWLVDPAAYGGHRESDLAMLALFGTPFLNIVINAYNSVSPLAPGWQDRVALHQVYPLLVHTAMFGRGYARQAVYAARTALRLC